MRGINKIIGVGILMVSFVFVFGACEGDEWDPVFCGNKTPKMEKPVQIEANTTIAELKTLYSPGKPVDITTGIVIGGRVISDDSSGNIYKSLFIRDTTGAIEIKIGKPGLYNDYKQGQQVYILCDGLTLGGYKGSVSLGFKNPGEGDAEYETGYLDIQPLIDAHIVKGPVREKVSPIVIGEKDLKNDKYVDSYVRIENLRYGCNEDRFSKATRQIFTMVYVDPDGDRKSQSNRIFISGDTYNVTTWSMSAENYINHLKSGDFDGLTTADGSARVPEIKDILIKNATPCIVSQYFLCGSTDVQIRTSGYCKFADEEIDSDVLKGEKTVTAEGILGTYDGKVQLTLLGLEGVRVNG